MAKNKNEATNQLRLRPQYLNCMWTAFLPNFGETKKLGSDFTLDELVEWYKINTVQSNEKHFLGTIPTDYKSPFSKDFPTSPIDKTLDDVD